MENNSITDSDTDDEPTYEELRPFKCAKCTNRFASKENLVFHISNVHSRGSFKCSKCNFRCSTIGQIVQHNQKRLHKKRHSMSEVQKQNGDESAY